MEIIPEVPSLSHVDYLLYNHPELAEIEKEMSGEAAYDYVRLSELDEKKNALEERLLEMERREQESLEKAKKYAAQKRELQKRQKAEESRKRTHRLCVIGGAVESVLGCPIEEEDIPKLIGFLKRQEANGRYFSKAMQKEQIPETEEV